MTRVQVALIVFALAVILIAHMEGYLKPAMRHLKRPIDALLYPIRVWCTQRRQRIWIPGRSHWDALLDRGTDWRAYEIRRTSRELTESAQSH